MGIAQMFRRFYMQFIVIVLIAVIFAYILNALFSIPENQTRIMFTAIFLAGFAMALMVLEKIF